MTLTKEAETDTYAATMENKNAAVENAPFDSVASTQYAIPAGFEPTTGADTSNHYVSKLNGNNKRVGPTILLRVMAGDTLTASTYTWYSGTPQTPGSEPSLLNSIGDIICRRGTWSAGQQVYTSPGRGFNNGGGASAHLFFERKRRGLQQCST